ncbi:MAG TPA: 2-C-methyl-D-erythritol 4-phosphate cytidylyltransferase [Acidimicrobiales bacterium]|nr:2-C-methyl-D-erythritol 4-phosphate cytidylyltransferase [Acidimicrobiales bacterium]
MTAGTSTMPGVWAIVVAGGSASRFGRPKQFAELAGRRVLDHALAAARACSEGAVLVLPEDAVALGPWACERVVAGGATRAASVRAGLRALPEAAEIIVVHDAARPLATPALFEAVVAAVRGGADGAIPGIPLADTVKRVEGVVVVETLPREALVAVQTPQAFRAAVLRRAHAGEPDATDDAGLLEAIGARVVVVPGEACNLKLTRPADLVTAAALIEAGAVLLPPVVPAVPVVPAPPGERSGGEDPAGGLQAVTARPVP